MNEALLLLLCFYCCKQIDYFYRDSISMFLEKSKGSCQWGKGLCEQIKYSSVMFLLICLLPCSSYNQGRTDWQGSMAYDPLLGRRAYSSGCKLHDNMDTHVVESCNQKVYAVNYCNKVILPKNI